MPEDPPGDASDEVVSKCCLGVAFQGRVLLWRTLVVGGSPAPVSFLFSFSFSVSCGSIVYPFVYLMSSNQKQLGNQQDAFWLALIKLATHFKHSKTVGFQFSSRASPDGFSIGRYEKKCEYFGLSAVKFKSGALRFPGRKLLKC